MEFPSHRVHTSLKYVPDSNSGHLAGGGWRVAGRDTMKINPKHVDTAADRGDGTSPPPPSDSSMMAQ
jgi:hypothetical protein